MSEQSKNSNRLAPVKRETGANPVRTRHRDREQEPQNHWETGKMADAMIFKPGDLPDCCTETIVSDHE